MEFTQHNRQYDLVLLGATGYTGRLTCEYIVKEFPATLKWAIAGRSHSKLQKLAESLSELDATRPPPALEVCDSSDAGLAALAVKTFAIVSYVGPYHMYGEPCFRACAENGTHYVDVCGEVVHTKKMTDLYAATAARSGAIMIPQCGIESAPSDMATFALSQTLQRELDARPGAVTLALRMHATPSGGTLATVFSLLESFSTAELKQAFTPYACSPVPRAPAPRTASLWSTVTGLRTVPGLGLLTTALPHRTDAAMVQRTWGLLESEPALKSVRYGPDFEFAEFARAPNALRGFFVHLMIVVLHIVMATPLLRKWARGYVTQPGDGPAREDANKEKIEYTGIAVPSPDTGKRAFCKVNFTGPMYYLTGLLALESVRVLLEVDTKLPGGVYTPACLGEPYLQRLGEHGFKIETSVIDA